MKKIFWVFFLSLAVLVFIFAFNPSVKATDTGGLVPCGAGSPVIDPNTGQCTANCPCGIEDFFVMLARIFNFIVKDIAAPLTILMLAIGGILLLISAGNPRLAELGKKTLYAAIIGLFLVLCAWLIINFILTTIGYKANWNVL